MMVKEDIATILQYAIPALIWVCLVSITLRLLTKQQAISVTLSWLMIVYVVPVIGIIAYFIFGEIKLGSRRAKLFHQLRPKYIAWFEQYQQYKNIIESSETLRYKPLFDLCQQRQKIPCILGNDLHIFNTPETIIQSIIQDIEKAKFSINMTFYIWQSGGLIEYVEQALIQAHQRGVKIHILLDSVGSRDFLQSEHCQQLRQQGLEFFEALHANPLRMFLERIDLRQHRKIVVIDNQISYTGSMNMVDPSQFKQSANVGQWIDIMVRMDGPVSSILNHLHAWDWEIETEQQQSLAFSLCPLLPIEHDNSHAVQILATGPGFPDDLMSQALLTAIFAARKSITITSPYFVPSQSIEDALKIAAQRGVEVNIILPQKNDSTMVQWASRALFDNLLAAGVKIHQFTGGLLHTKSILIDQRLALVGSVNMDIRSIMLNFEVMIIVEDRDFAKEIAALHHSYYQQTMPLDYQQWRTRPLWQRIIERLFFFFSPLL
ncbi:cardiolipin synthetase [Gallibacterium genomosp. 3]|uniref:Cardiolipin synthase A n=2 Tax=Gallibacterium genomosp. 3 TaxID=505345 RepID=A0A1A7QBE6_9PAST|nr:cardiolipin synthetase [Gallibacterium genomosp. 3]